MKTGLNFQTCTIINKVDNKVFFRQNPVTKEEDFIVRPGLSFNKEDIAEVRETLGYEGVNEVVTIDFSGITDANATETKYYRLDIYLKVSGAEPFVYSTPWVQKGHPFWCDFVVKKGAKVADVTKAVVDSLQKDQIFQLGVEQIKAEVATDKLKLTAQFDYLRFAKINLVVLNEAGDDTEVVASLGDAAITKDTVGKNAFGTYSYIIQNLRLPTAENTGWAHLHADETPIVGAIYDHFVLEQYTTANNHPLGAVGCEVQSHTLHSFWVLHSEETAFKKVIEQAKTVKVYNADGTAVTVHSADTHKAVKSELDAKVSK